MVPFSTFYIHNSRGEGAAEGEEGGEGVRQLRVLVCNRGGLGRKGRVGVMSGGS